MTCEKYLLLRRRRTSPESALEQAGVRDTHERIASNCNRTGNLGAGCRSTNIDPARHGVACSLANDDVVNVGARRKNQRILAGGAGGDADLRCSPNIPST